MSPKDEEKRWKEFERELRKAIAKDQAMTKQEYQAWLNTLPEYVPAGTGNTVKVIFFGRKPGRARKGENL